MRFEGHHAPGNAVPLSRRPCGFDHNPVAEMQAVEIAERDHATAYRVRGLIEVAEEAHGRGIQGGLDVQGVGDCDIKCNSRLWRVQVRLGTISVASPSMTTVPPTAQVVLKFARLRSGNNSMISTVATTVSPIRTGALNRNDCAT